MPKLTGNSPVGVMFQGSEIEVEPDIAHGEAIQNIDHWYHDKNGWYYWSGMAEKIAEEPPPAPPGSTIGGIMVFPALPPEDPDSEQAHPAAQPPPPLANDDTLLANEDIPQGETRSVPSLAVLLEDERRLRAGVGILPKPAPELESLTSRSIIDVQTTRSVTTSAARDPLAPPPVILASRDIMTPPPAPVTPPPITPTAAFWQNPASQKLNWGLQNYLIVRDWWLSRRLTGRGVSIAILSTGADSGHPDLVNLGGQYQKGNDAMTDRHGLGTQAAVVAAGCGQTVFGVAPEARLLIGKLGEQDHLLTAENLIEGLRWAIDARADVVAMLVDLPDLNVEQLEELQILINRAIDQGMLLVAPVGTSENKKPESRYPARLTGVLSVGAHDQYGQRCGFSARSYDLDLLAPGEGLLTSTPGRQTVINMKSASIATAFTAGFLALVRQWQRENNQTSAPALVFNLLCETATSRRAFNKGEDVEYGHGLLNPIDLLKKLDDANQDSTPV